MELSASYMFICNNQFLGVMRSAIIKEFHDIKLKVDFYKILTNDRQLIEMVKKNCEEDHANVDTLKLLSTDNVYSKVFNYNDCENFVKYLGFINSRNIQEDMNRSQLWIVDFKFEKDVNFFKIPLNSLQVLRLYTQVNSFYSNYLIFSSILKQHLNNDESQPVKSDKKVTEYIPVQEVELSTVVTPQQLISRERSELDEIFELCINSSVKSSLIHYTFNYFKYITNKHCKILTNDKKQVQYTLPMLLPKNTNEQYFNSLILSNISVSSNNILFVVKKILHNLHTNYAKYQDNTLYLMMINYLLFVYLLRYLHDSNREFFRINFKQFINNVSVQNQIISKVIEVGFADFAAKVFFKITDTDLSDVNEEYNLEKINKLSQEFQHLLPVSQQIFADNVFKNLNEPNKREEPKDFKITQKKVFDIIRLMDTNQKQIKTTHSLLFDPDNILHVDEATMNEYNFLDYKLISSNGSKVITKTYQRMLDYVKNPSSILLMTENEIPKEVKNLFDIISKKVLNMSKITKDMISTFSYYNILLDCIPHPMEFKHTTFLYIIFYIIIPYHFDVYGNSQYEDVFL